jgi:hypothetical protein
LCNFIGIGIGYAVTANTEVEYLGTIADTPSACPDQDVSISRHKSVKLAS